jgi:hypothetical protein
MGSTSRAFFGSHAKDGAVKVEDLSAIAGHLCDAHAFV